MRGSRRGYSRVRARTRPGNPRRAGIVAKREEVPLHRIRLAALSLVVCSLVLSLASEARAGKVNKSLFGTAVQGYDVVAYFGDGRAVEGRREHTHEWMGASWRFASADHRDRFAANPEQYAPQYGGFCAYAVSQGATAGIDPEAWKIVDGKLYLNLSRSIQQIWRQDIPGDIRLADENWPELSGD